MMSEGRQQITATPKQAVTSRSMLQRKCACGGTPGPTGECAACRRKRKLHEEGRLQTKLRVSQPGDTYEREADRIAAQVMRMPEPRSGNRTSEGNTPDAKWRSPVSVQRLPLLQRLATPAAPFTTEASSAVRAAWQASGRPLDMHTRRFMEPRFGHDFSQVRIHTSPAAERAARTLDARAFCRGNDLFFAAGQYQPHSTDGRRLLAHELTHTLQQHSTGGAELYGHGDGTAVTNPNQRLGLQRAPRQHAGTAIDIFRQMNPACRETNRYPGNLAHEVIELYYQNVLNPISAREFSIPGSGPTGGVGYADFVDLRSPTIYEIKTYLGGPAGVNEAANYRNHAQINCDPNVTWRVGLAFPESVIPVGGGRELVAKQYLGQQPGYPTWPGVVVYWFRRRRRQPVRDPIRVPDWFLVFLLFLLLALIVIAIIIAILEPTPAGEAVLAGAAVLLLLHFGIIGEANAAEADTLDMAGVPPEAVGPPPFERRSGLQAELTSLAEANGDLFDRLHSDPTNLSVDDVRRFVRLGTMAMTLIEQADSDDPFVTTVQSALSQVAPVIRRVMGTDEEEAP